MDFERLAAAISNSLPSLQRIQTQPQPGSPQVQSSSPQALLQADQVVSIF